MTISKMRKLTGMTQKSFAEYLDIPIRTIEDWEHGRRKPNPYILSLIEYKLSNENMFIGTGDKMEMYFNKNGYVFGVSSIFNFGKWNHSVTYFTNYAEATDWLHTETYDFAEREICSKSKAISLAGTSAVKKAIGLIS